MNIEPQYKLYKGRYDGGLYIIKDDIFAYYKPLKKTTWLSYAETVETFVNYIDYKDFVTFVRNMTEEDVFMELL